MKKILLVHIFLCFCSFFAVAQVPSPAQAQQMKVENLTDEQVRQIVEEMKKNKVQLDQMDQFAAAKGIPSGEVIKLKDRIKSLNLDKELAQTAPTSQVAADRSMNDGTTVSARDIQPMSEAERLRSRIYGAELFNNKNLTFEPNLRVPTPPNYKLASGDEVVIDVYGYSEVQHTLKVTPEGYIRIPNLGPVYISGLTMEEARNRISKQLATIYGGIKSGNTFVQVSLGNIRSIRVLLIGEVVRPGSYTLTSLSTIANALYVSGGPGENGSFRDIQVIRNGSPIVTFDLYDFLRSGDLQNNIVLQDQDIIKVNPYQSRVELSGEVKRPAIFEVKQGETLKDVIDMAGGYTDISYKDVIRAYRLNNKEREIVTITAAEVPAFTLRSGDKFFIDAVLNRFSNRVMISGAVRHPGEYALEQNMSIKDLIQKAAGLKEDASLSRAIVFRLQEDLTPSSSSFKLEDVVSGKEVISLRREDSVVIYSKSSLREEYQVKVSGEVNNPGFFKYSDSLHVEDLILMAGGFRDAASFKRVEVSRRIRSKDYAPGDSAVTIVAQFDVTSDLAAMSGYFLEPFDEVSVRRSPSYEAQANVSIEGEVVYPGNYTIQSSREKISDLLRRAGGLRTEAYPEGAYLMRRTFNNASDSALLNEKMQIYYNKVDTGIEEASVKTEATRRQQLLGINLNQIIKAPGSRYDLFLEEGDIIKIPKQLQTVQLFGEVFFPKKVRFASASNFREYIRSAGGFTSKAMKKGSYIVYPNGEVKSTRKVLFFNSFPKVKPGSEIYVPARGPRKGLSTQEAVGLTTGMASIALIIFTILNRNN